MPDLLPPSAPIRTEPALFPQPESLWAFSPEALPAPALPFLSPDDDSIPHSDYATAVLLPLGIDFYQSAVLPRRELETLFVFLIPVQPYFSGSTEFHHHLKIYRQLPEQQSGAEPDDQLRDGISHAIFSVSHDLCQPGF